MEMGAELFVFGVGSIVDFRSASVHASPPEALRTYTWIHLFHGLPSGWGRYISVPPFAIRGETAGSCHAFRVPSGFRALF